MSKKTRLSHQLLYDLRNKAPVHLFMAEVLGVHVKYSEGYYRFQCPLCNEMNTAINHKTNLARCFRCNENFNPIDIAIEIRGCSFLDAVGLVQRYLED